MSHTGCGPRAELIEEAARELHLSITLGQKRRGWDDLSPDERSTYRSVTCDVLTRALPLLTLADLPAALLDGHEQQIRAKVGGEIGAEKRRAVDRAPGWFAGMANAEHIAARGTEGGTR